MSLFLPFVRVRRDPATVKQHEWPYWYEARIRAPKGKYLFSEYGWWHIWYYRVRHSSHKVWQVSFNNVVFEETKLYTRWDAFKYAVKMAKYMGHIPDPARNQKKNEQ